MNKKLSYSFYFGVFWSAWGKHISEYVRYTRSQCCEKQHRFVSVGFCDTHTKN